MLSSHLPHCCHISLPYIMGFDIKIVHQRIQTTPSHTSHCHHCHYCNVEFVLFHMSHATLILYYHASILTLQTFLISVHFGCHRRDIREVTLYRSDTIIESLQVVRNFKSSSVHVFKVLTII